MKKILYILALLALAVFTRGCSLPRIEGGKVAGRVLADGVYEGSYAKFPVRAIVNVTVRDLQITDVQLVMHRNWRGKPAEAVIERIVEEQSTDVDVVTGATMSSRVIMNAVEDALKKAVK